MDRGLATVVFAGSRRLPALDPHCRALLLLAVLSLTLAACWPDAPGEGTPLREVTSSEPATHEVRVRTGDLSQTINTSARTVGDALVANGIEVGAADEITPPLWAPLAGPPPVAEIIVARISESEEFSPEIVPFSREVVRTIEMAPDDPPVVIQRGQNGFQDVVYRIVYRNGLEIDRWVAEIRILKHPTNELIMVGIGADQSEQPIAGTLAFVSDGRPVIARTNTSQSFSLDTAGMLDGRVFQLSPAGDWLLFSRADSSATFDNSLWVIATQRDSVPVPLNLDNVLWAGWDPSRPDAPRIAYTTARSLPNPPGWEANNDIWVLSLNELPSVTAAPLRVAEGLASAYSWWGGAYAWAPDGRSLAYAFADSVGVLLLPEDGTSEPDLNSILAGSGNEPRTLWTFPPYDAGGDWAWVPSLSWSPDSRFLLFTEHTDDEATERGSFTIRQIDVESGDSAPFAPDAGIWSHSSWVPISEQDPTAVFLKIADPAEGLAGDYALWVGAVGGIDLRQLYPPTSESGRFPAVAQFLAWEPGGEHMAFIYGDALHILNPQTGTLFRQRQDDSIDALPSWAPYGPDAVGP